MLSSAKAAVRQGLRHAGYDLTPIVRDDRALYRELFGVEAVENRRFYNIGAGAFSHPAWTNIDKSSDWYADAQVDIIDHDLMGSEPLPIASGTAEIVYTSHTIEHVDDAAVERLFSDVYRALKPGGIFRVTTGPDAETDFAALMRGDEHWFYWDRATDAAGTGGQIFFAPAASVPLEERWLHHVATQLAPNDRSPSPAKFAAPAIRAVISERGFPGCVEYFTSLCEFQPERPGNHISWWTHGKVTAFLQRAGFTTIYRSGYGQSASPVLRNTHYFDNTHPQMSLYVEAVR
jgi:SAM-dependent methyltransferase